MLVVLKVVNNYDFNSSAQSLDLIFNLFIYFIYIHVSSYLKKIDLTSSNFTLIRKIKKKVKSKIQCIFPRPNHAMHILSKNINCHSRTLKCISKMLGDRVYMYILWLNLIFICFLLSSRKRWNCGNFTACYCEVSDVLKLVQHNIIKAQIITE